MGRCRVGELGSQGKGGRLAAAGRSRRPKVPGRRPAESVRVHRQLRSELVVRQDNCIENARRRTDARTPRTTHNFTYEERLQHSLDAGLVRVAEVGDRVKYRYGGKLFRGTIMSFRPGYRQTLWVLVSARHRSQRAVEYSCLLEILE